MLFWFQVKYANLEKFKDIASEPSEKYAFEIKNYNGLTDILENFQKKIFNMEGEDQLSISVLCLLHNNEQIWTSFVSYLGSSVARAGDMTGEMSQSGFSAVYYKVSNVKKIKSDLGCHSYVQ